PIGSFGPGRSVPSGRTYALIRVSGTWPWRWRSDRHGRGCFGVSSLFLCPPTIKRRIPPGDKWIYGSLREIEAGGEAGSQGVYQERLSACYTSVQTRDSFAAALVPRSLATTGDSFIRCRVSEQMKGPQQTITERRQVTESALVRQLIEAMVQMATTAGVSDEVASKRVIRDGRTSQLRKGAAAGFTGAPQRLPKRAGRAPMFP